MAALATCLAAGALAVAGALASYVRPGAGAASAIAAAMLAAGGVHAAARRPASEAVLAAFCAIGVALAFAATCSAQPHELPVYFFLRDAFGG